jgi:hypothetical protein
MRFHENEMYAVHSDPTEIAANPDHLGGIKKKKAPSNLNNLLMTTTRPRIFLPRIQRSQAEGRRRWRRTPETWSICQGRKDLRGNIDGSKSIPPLWGCEVEGVASLGSPIDLTRGKERRREENQSIRANLGFRKISFALPPFLDTVQHARQLSHRGACRRRERGCLRRALRRLAGSSEV